MEKGSLGVVGDRIWLCGRASHEEPQGSEEIWQCGLGPEGAFCDRSAGRGDRTPLCTQCRQPQRQGKAESGQRAQRAPTAAAPRRDPPIRRHTLFSLVPLLRGLATSGSNKPGLNPTSGESEVGSLEKPEECVCARLPKSRKL